MILWQRWQLVLAELNAQRDASLSERIVFELCGPGTIDEWRARLPDRPDWQAAIERVRELLREEV